jgi:hypothetical protein
LPVTWEQNGIPDRGSVDQVWERGKGTATDVIMEVSVIEGKFRKLLVTPCVA